MGSCCSSSAKKAKNKPVRHAPRRSELSQWMQSPRSARPTLKSRKTSVRLVLEDTPDFIRRIIDDTFQEEDVVFNMENEQTTVHPKDPSRDAILQDDAPDPVLASTTSKDVVEQQTSVERTAGATTNSLGPKIKFVDGAGGQEPRQQVEVEIEVPTPFDKIEKLLEPELLSKHEVRDWLLSGGGTKNPYTCPQSKKHRDHFVDIVRTLLQDEFEEIREMSECLRVPEAHFRYLRVERFFTETLPDRNIVRFATTVEVHDEEVDGSPIAGAAAEGEAASPAVITEEGEGMKQDGNNKAQLPGLEISDRNRQPSAALASEPSAFYRPTGEVGAGVRAEDVKISGIDATTQDENYIDPQFLGQLDEGSLFRNLIFLRIQEVWKTEAEQDKRNKVLVEAMKVSVEKLKSGLTGPGGLATEVRTKDYVPYTTEIIDPVYGLSIPMDIRINYEGESVSAYFEVLGLPVALGELWTVMQEVDLGPELNPLCTEAEMVKQWSKGDFLSSNVVKLPVPMMRPVQTFNQNFFFDLLTANESNSTAWIDPNWQYYPTSLGTNPEICLLDGTSARTGKNRKRDRLRSRMHSQRTRGPAGEDLTAEKDEFHLPPGFVVMMYSPKFGDGSEKTHKYEVPDLPYRDTVVPGLSKKECKTLKRNYTDAMVALVTPKRRKNPKFGGGGGGGGGNSKTTSTSTPSKKKASTASPAPATSSSTSAKNQNEQEEDKEAELSPEAGGAPQPLLANGNVNPEFSEYVDAMEIRGVITMEFSSTVRWMCPNAVVRKIANKITNDVTIALGELHRNFATSEFGYRQREKDSAAQLLNEMRSRAAVFNAKNEG